MFIKDGHIQNFVSRSTYDRDPHETYTITFADQDSWNQYVQLPHCFSDGKTADKVFVATDKKKRKVSMDIPERFINDILSTPKRRITVCTTQMLFSVCTIVLMFSVTTAAHIIINQVSPLALDSEAFTSIGLIGLTGDLTVAQIVKINLSAMVSCLALGGVCYMFSCIFNLSKYSTGASGVVAGVSMLTALLGIFGKVMNNGLKNIRYASMFALFDYENVLTGENTWWILMIAALAVAVLTYGIGTVWFSKKDLPL